MKCPYCNEELKICSQYTDGTSKLFCSKCDWFGDNRLFEALSKTKRALDVAVNALNLYSTSSLSAMAKEVLHIIKQITETKE